MNLEYTLAAESDLASILDYVARHDPAAARRLVPRIRKAARRLERFPFSAPKRRRDDTRILVIPGTPYFAIYQIASDEVQVLRIYHDARNIPR